MLLATLSARAQDSRVESTAADAVVLETLLMAQDLPLLPLLLEDLVVSLHQHPRM